MEVGEKELPCSRARAAAVWRSCLLQPTQFTVSEPDPNTFFPDGNLSQRQARWSEKSSALQLQLEITSG
jgi:hypothetical protein